MRDWEFYIWSRSVVVAGLEHARQIGDHNSCRHRCRSHKRRGRSFYNSNKSVVFCALVYEHQREVVMMLPSVSGEHSLVGAGVQFELDSHHSVCRIFRIDSDYHTADK